LWNISHLQL